MFKEVAFLSTTGMDRQEINGHVNLIQKILWLKIQNIHKDLFSASIISLPIIIRVIFPILLFLKFHLVWLPNPKRIHCVAEFFFFLVTMFYTYKILNLGIHTKVREKATIKRSLKLDHIINSAQRKPQLQIPCRYFRIIYIPVFNDV